MTTSMTTVTPDVASAIVAELGGSSAQSVEMMIGIGLVKDSEAVYFQYLGEERAPAALTMPSGKPCTRMANITLAGISIADGIGAENATKLNLIVETSAGRRLLLTSGIQTWWTQCLIQGLMGLFNSYNLDEAFTLDSYKGKSGRRPVFCSVRQAGAVVKDQMMYDQLGQLRSDRAMDKFEAAVRDSVEILNQAVTGGTVDEAIVTVDEPVKEGDF
jgi:hypothetical protein